MAEVRTEEEQLQFEHGHCADELMSDYGIPKEMRVEVCRQVAAVWQQITLIHDYIIASVRGALQYPQTDGLKAFLEKHATRENMNHKSNWGRRDADH